MRSLLSNLVRAFRTANTPRTSRRASRRAILQLEGAEERLALSTASPLTAVEFQPMFVLAQQASSRPAFNATFNSTDGYTPLQIRTAYGVNNSTATGAGQTIAIVDADNDPDLFSDLDVFDKQFATTSSGSTLYQQYGAASSFLTVYNQNGQVINPSDTSVPVDSTGDWEVEESLDVQWAHAIAPGASIDLVEANSANSLYTAVASAAKLPGVSVVSMSWGAAESSGENKNDGIFTTPAGHTGVTFLAAAGDDSFGLYPAFSPNVIAVGGTTLTLTANNTIQSETAWSTGSDSWDLTLGTGGGTSTQESEPSYQQGFQSTGMRTIPDVSFDADPNTGVAVFDSFGGSAVNGVSGWQKIGGTSLATPAWGGLIAMANQQRAVAGLPALNSTSPTQAQTLLYGLSGVAFNDIASGSITANGHTFTAGPGYDEVTGLGSPVANQVVDHLSDTLDLVGDQIPGYPDDTYAVGTTASGGLQVTINGATESFAPGAIRVVNIDAGAGLNNVDVNALPAGVFLNIDNTTPGHSDSVSIGSNEASLPNIAGTVYVASTGGTTALLVYGTADATGRTYTVRSSQVSVSGMPGVVDYFGDVNSLTINGGSGNNAIDVLSTAANVPVTINAGSGTNHINITGSSSAVNITGFTNYVTIGGDGSLASISGPVNISNTSNAAGTDGRSYVTIEDTTGLSYTTSGSSIEFQGGLTINLGDDVVEVTINTTLTALYP